jgi:hypothetical protein
MLSRRRDFPYIENGGFSQFHATQTRWKGRLWDVGASRNIERPRRSS